MSQTIAEAEEKRNPRTAEEGETVNIISAARQQRSKKKKKRSGSVLSNVPEEKRVVIDGGEIVGEGNSSSSESDAVEIETDDNNENDDLEEHVEEGVFQVQRRRLRFKPSSRAVIFSGAIQNFTAVSRAAAALMKGPVRETRMTRNGELVVEVENDEDAAALSGCVSLAGVPVVTREAKGLVVSKGTVYGVHRSIPAVAILESLRAVGVTEAVRVQSRDPHLGERIDTDRVILTFSKAVAIPEQVDIGLNTHAVVAYYEPLQCFRCNPFGHISKACPETDDRCRQCTMSGHLSTTCTRQPKCVNCAGTHSARYGSCPARLRIIENWRRSLRPPQGHSNAAVPVITPASGVNADSNFRNGRSYAGVVSNGVRVAPAVRPRAPTVPQAPGAPLMSPAAPPSVVPSLDIEALTASITASVLSSVTAQLESLVTRVVSQVLSATIPRITEVLLTTLRGIPAIVPAPSPAVPSAASSIHGLDLDDLIRRGLHSSSGDLPASQPLSHLNE